MLLRMVSLKRSTSCGTKPSWLRKLFQRDPPDGHPIDQHFAISGIEHPSDQIGDGALAAAGMAHDGQGAASGNVERDTCPRPVIPVSG